jgi:hypothetical protein
MYSPNTRRVTIQENKALRYADVRNTSKKEGKRPLWRAMEVYK